MTKQVKTTLHIVYKNLSDHKKYPVEHSNLYVYNIQYIVIRPDKRLESHSAYITCTMITKLLKEVALK